MNREDIKKLLPHREPMLLVDSLEVDENGIGHGTYSVRGDEWFLQGHFPGNPVVPGVILCEMMAQTCSIILGGNLEGKTPYYTGLDHVRFKRKVRVGDLIEITCSLEQSKGPFYFTKSKAYVDGNLCCEGNLSFALVEGR